MWLPWPASCLVLLAMSASAVAESLTLAPVFGAGMVLQQKVKIPVWGTAPAGIWVSVSFADQRQTTLVKESGDWEVTLEALAASNESRTLHVTTGKYDLLVTDILVGDVWLAAGQSNMEFPLAKEAHATKEIPLADFPRMRLLNYTYAGQNYSARAFDREVLDRLSPERFFRGAWERCTPAAARNFSAVAYYFAKEIHGEVKTPVGVIQMAVGGSPTEAWIPRDSLARSKELKPLVQGDWLHNEHLEPWCQQRATVNLAQAKQELGEPPPDGWNHAFKPGFLWEAGPARLQRFPLRGVLWYQGESNSLSLRRVRQHAQLFPLLIDDWRRGWGTQFVPFMYCQLSSIGTEGGYKSQFWPEFREVQSRSIRPGMGMAVTSDLGHPTDVHPRNKREVGHRLALLALRRVFRRDIIDCGPIADLVHNLDGKSLEVTFLETARGLRTSDGRPAASFEVAGADGVYHPAEAVLGEETATLTSAKVAAPVSARYGWQPYSTGNLVNSEGLPASTFLLKLPEP